VLPLNSEKEKEIVEGFKNIRPGRDIEEKMLARREIFLWGEVNDDSARAVVQKILYFDGEKKGDIKLYINSPGGSISAGLAIYDAMQYASSDISTICMGQAASMGAVLLCAGAKGKRYCWENSRVLIHQPLIAGNMYGPASDIQIQAVEMLKIREKLNAILAKHTGQTVKKIEEDTDRDYFMAAEEALSYGIVDEVCRG
jgi:ATP-dependent Clp protease protease subunit